MENEMALVPSSKVRKVRGISPAQNEQITNYMQGAIYGWIKSHKSTKFAVRDLVGGVNFDWSGTPLYALYKKHRDAGKNVDAAITGAGIDLGWIVKGLLTSDKRAFKAGKKGLVRGYTWLGN